MHDEGVQLKVLQTALTLMQSTTLAQNEASAHSAGCICGISKSQVVKGLTRRCLLQEGIAMVLGTCFRLLANAKNTDSVTNTAAATVRQVLLHAHTYVPCPL